MTTKSIFSKEIVESPFNSEFSRYASSSNFIYVSTVLLIVVIVFLLPLVRIDVSIASSGILRPSIEISSIKIPSSGKVREIFVSINQRVRRGEKMLELDSEILEQRISFLSGEIDEDKLKANDLSQLILGNFQSSNIITPFYKQSLHNYSQKREDLVIRYNKAKIDYNRNFKLHKEMVIADVEFEAFQFELDKAKNDLELLTQNQLSQWQSQYSEYEKEIAEHETQLKQFEEERKNLTIRSPVSGTIESLASIHEESQVFANQDLAQISPDTSLIVESYVKPSDIGLLKPDMDVRFQIDAFNYNQWGLATGKIVSISNDVHIISDAPVFKVKCSLDKEFLQLKNSYKGYLKKGMTLQARFMVTERTLWQLLYDNVDDWINPNTFTN